MMPQSARILTTACPNPAVPLEDCQREYGRVTCSASSQKSRYARPLSFPPSCKVQRPGFSISSRWGYQSSFTSSACAPSLALNGKTMCQMKKSSREPASQQRVHLASGASVLGWPHHKDGRWTHAQSSLLHWAPRRKTQLWCSKTALQRSVEETACIGGKQPSVMAAEASVWDSWHSVKKASCNFEAGRQEAAKEKHRRQKEWAASQSSSTQTFVCPKCSKLCTSRISLYSHQRACKVWPRTFPRIVVCEEWAFIISNTALM